jgi:DNA repair protein RadD
MTLRPYQRAAIDALYGYWSAGSPDGNGALIVAPTGSGKTAILATLVREIQEDWPGTRILILTHVKELIAQGADEIKAIWPEAPIGVYSAGLGRRELSATIVYAGIQSIAKRVDRLYPPPEIVIIDEAHLVPRSTQTRYKRTIDMLTAMYPRLQVVGLTATPYRLDSGLLTEGEDAVFSRIVYDIPIQMLIDEGYLSPITTRAGNVSIDTSDVKHSGKEYNQGDLQRHAMAGDTTARAVADIVRRGAGRRKWLLFACGVEHAAQIASYLNDHGIANAVVTGATPRGERDAIVHEFRAGALRAVVNVNVLTTGFNVPSIDLIAMLRPTESAALYVQQLGRGMRTAHGKTDCLVLDYAGNAVKHGPIDLIEPTAPGAGDGDAPAKECPECHAIIATGHRACPDCGYEFPPPEIKVTDSHKEAPLLASQIKPETLTVMSTGYYRHTKAGRPDSVRIEYACGLVTHREWIFPEADNQRANYYYVKWCREAGIDNPPRSVDTFLNDESIHKQASEIDVIKDGKYWRVVGRRYVSDV